VARSIIQTAITNKALRLELEYRQPSMFRDGDAGFEGPTIDTGVALPCVEQQTSDEFAGLLRLI
jgi:hypothetical protein